MWICMHLSRFFKKLLRFDLTTELLSDRPLLFCILGACSRQNPWGLSLVGIELGHIGSPTSKGVCLYQEHFLWRPQNTLMISDKNWLKCFGWKWDHLDSACLKLKTPVKPFHLIILMILKLKNVWFLCWIVFPFFKMGQLLWLIIRQYPWSPPHTSTYMYHLYLQVLAVDLVAYLAHLVYSAHLGALDALDAVSSANNWWFSILNSGKFNWLNIIMIVHEDEQNLQNVHISTHFQKIHKNHGTKHEIDRNELLMLAIDVPNN